MSEIDASPVLERLQAVVQSSPDLKEMAQLYAIVLPILRDADLHVEPVSIDPEQAHAKLEAGLALLHDAELALDDDAACALLVGLARALEASDQKARSGRRFPWTKNAKPNGLALYERAQLGDVDLLRASASRQIRVAFESGGLPVGPLLAHVAAGDRAFVSSLAQSRQLDAGLLWTLAQNTLKPALQAWCRQLEPLARDLDWPRGYCFVCGAAATLAQLQDNAEGKHLRCGMCGADWSFPRLRCMYCGNSRQDTLSYLYSEGQRDKVRIEVCDECGGYLKVVTSFSPLSPEMLPVEDLATLHFDFIAQERGYARVPLR